ncbi:MAG: hypothetical protein Ct9H300mP17_14870 [Candidatus Nitrosopelagicus sp.]|nr:MAG: hypothetical protein Ct9H300mP17_14870 [Candidatus Nitrosopelagicus sp.]
MVNLQKVAKGLRALEFTNGIVEEVTDKEMLDGMSVVGLNGFDCENGIRGISCRHKEIT